MATYTYSLHDYRAIKNASIRLDGITVLAGENGCGKSTLSRWLYYIVNGANNYDQYAFGAFKSDVLRQLQRLTMVARDFFTGVNAEQNGLTTTLRSSIQKITAVNSTMDEEALQQISSVFDVAISGFGKELSAFLKSNRGVAYKKDRMLSFLSLDNNDKEGNDVLAEFSEHQEAYMHNAMMRYMRQRETRPVSDFFYYLQHNYRYEGGNPVNVKLEEEGVNLFKKNQVGNLYNLKRAIYVDTPMAVSSDVADENVFWHHLKRMMYEPRTDFDMNGDAVQLLLKKMSLLLHGKATVEKDMFGEPELHYVREDGLNIKLDSVATGFKAFSYMQKLLENGYLDSETLLLIDEPEAHLHPQWIVEFARLLVLLNKHLGVKIMVASHNPDMVAAIQTIAQKEDTIDHANFYIAEPNGKRFAYTYRMLDHEIDDIFTSFNIAYERMHQYGSEGV